MDTVRFGRALGTGAREAAKALVSAADAAASPAPDRGTGPAPQPSPVEARAAVLGQQTARKVEQAKRTGKGVREGGKRFGEAAWGPVVKLSGVLWLEFTGTFFALFAVFACVQTWNDRAALHDLGANHAQHQHLLAAAAMAIVFGYFAVSGFVKAAKRGRR